MATSGDEYMHWRQLVWKILAQDYFQKFIRPKDTLLDMPTGFGEFINHIKCQERIAADMNPDSKKFLRKGIKFIHCHSAKIPLKDKYTDKIFCSNFFEHITHQEILKTIGEFRRVLKDDGQVLVFQPNIRFLASDFWRFFDHITAIDDRGLEDAFGLQGFSLVYRVERFFPFTVKSLLPKSAHLVRLYLRLPFLWRFFGQQSFLIFEKTLEKLKVTTPASGPIW